MPKSENDHENTKTRKHESTKKSTIWGSISCFRAFVILRVFGLESSILWQTQLHCVSPRCTEWW